MADCFQFNVAVHLYSSAIQKLLGAALDARLSGSETHLCREMGRPEMSSHRVICIGETTVFGMNG